MSYSPLKDLLIPILQRFRLVRFRRKWRRTNKHNITIPSNVFPIEKVKVGRCTYGEILVKTYGNSNSQLSIGNYCSIAENVTFLIDGEHHYKRFTSYPFPSKMLNKENDSGSKGQIIVEDDVWIGYGAIILSGVTLGRGCIVGAGSVVAQNIPPYAIYANGKIIKYRFNDAIISRLNNINYSTLTEKSIDKNYELLKMKVDEYNIEQIIDACQCEQ